MCLFVENLEAKMKWLKNYERVQEIQQQTIWQPITELDPRAFIPEVSHKSKYSDPRATIPELCHKFSTEVQLPWLSRKKSQKTPFPFSVPLILTLMSKDMYTYSRILRQCVTFQQYPFSFLFSLPLLCLSSFLSLALSVYVFYIQEAV